MWFIPIIGPLINMVTSIFTKAKNAEVEEYKTASGASVAVIQATKDDPGVRLARDLIMFPVSVWTALFAWDKIVEHNFPNLVWNVMPLTNMEYLPTVVLAFLFGTVALGARKWLR